MIVTGVLLFLLGTKFEPTSAAHFEVNYELNKIKISKEIHQKQVRLPELGYPPYVTNFIHQGSNYFFRSPISNPPGISPPRVETRTLKEEKECKNETTVYKLDTSETRKKELSLEKSVIQVNPRQIIEIPKVKLPIPNVSLNIQILPLLPSIQVPIISSQLISQLPINLEDLKIPGLALLKASKVPNSMFIKSDQKFGDIAISEVDVQVKTIPPPPELPPLVLEDIFKPVIVEERKVILVPLSPETQTVVIPLTVRPTVVNKDKPCKPTLCAQNSI